MKAIFIGYPHFAKTWARNTQKYSKKSKFIALDTNASFLDKIKFIFQVFNADLVFCIGGTLVPGGALKLAWKLKKRIVLYWVGTDVSNAIEIIKSGGSKQFLEDCEHFSISENLSNELNHVGVKAPYLPITGIEESDNITWPQGFSVNAYIGNVQSEFYGLSKLINIAKKLPEVKFELYGLEKLPPNVTSNISTLGWIKDVKGVMMNHKVHIRIPEHDGMGISSLEALSIGRYVIRSNDTPETIHALEEEDVYQELLSLYEKHKLGELELNTDGIQYIKNNFDERTVFENFIEKIGG